MDLGESRSLTQIFQRNLLHVSHPFWAYVCAMAADHHDGDGNDGNGDDGDDGNSDDGDSDDGVGSGDHSTRST